MATVDLRFHLSDGGGRIEMVTLVDGEPKLQTFWSAGEIDDMLRIISSLRVHMAAAVPPVRPTPAKAVPIPDPAVTMLKDRESGGVVVSMRHPGFGWVDWTFSKDNLADMLSAMVAVLRSS